MVQVWVIDELGFYQNETKFVDKVTLLMTIVPLLVGYIKPQLVENEWVEGATEEEIKAWQEANKAPTPGPSVETEIATLKEQILELSDIIILMSQSQ